MSSYHVGGPPRVDGVGASNGDCGSSFLVGGDSFGGGSLGGGASGINCEAPNSSNTNKPTVAAAIAATFNPLASGANRAIAALVVPATSANAAARANPIHHSTSAESAMAIGPAAKPS